MLEYKTADFEDWREDWNDKPDWWRSRWDKLPGWPMDGPPPPEFLLDGARFEFSRVSIEEHPVGTFPILGWTYYNPVAKQQVIVEGAGRLATRAEYLAQGD